MTVGIIEYLRLPTLMFPAPKFAGFVEFQSQPDAHRKSVEIQIARNTHFDNGGNFLGSSTTHTNKFFGPCTPSVTVNSMSAVRLGPVMKTR